MSNFKLNNNSIKLSLFAAVVLVGGLFLTINSAQQKQEQRGRAAGTATSSIQTQCSAGKVQFVFSFTNPETYAIDLEVFDNDNDALEEEYENIAVGQTKTGTITTTKSSVTAGTVNFDWGPYEDTNPAEGGDQDKPYSAINCATSTSPTPTGTVTTVPSTTGSPTAIVTQNPIPSGKKAAADLNDDGNVNQVDYNLFLREIATQPGQ